MLRYFRKKKRRSEHMKPASAFHFASLLFTSLLPVPAGAQWLNYKTPGIPRTADHKPDLSAPAPRTSGGKPDFSGMWIPRDVLTCNTKERGV